ncbi:TRAP transporter small permease [Pseudomonas alkylphenolica]|uniref:TRAP transporter small permease protein n=1 Tax=Pseudomonas alkylphenolica TaxID=237609 RepID=A0A443ZQ71_9PSED|nr:TRAP transporter small permease [Pseudomonas alkylphenolica]RWU21183.1 TRAP transporter small permease [Pseudomonas alkylphenolica]
MQESLTIEFDAEQHRGWVRRTLLALTQSFALAGGVLLIGLVAMSMVSIVGRKLFSMPIRGDMELVEVGAAIAIAAFLPLCELRGTHIKVDALTSWLPALARDTLDGIGHLLCCAAAWILAWRTWLQMLDSREFGETTTLLAFPLWIPLLLIVPSLVLLGLCALARVQDICRKAGRRA